MIMPLPTLPADSADGPGPDKLDLPERVVALEDDAVTATVSALQDLMKQLEGVRARLDTKATTLLSAAGVSLTISGTLTTNAILNDKIVTPTSAPPLSVILCGALVMLVVCAGYSVRALLVGPGNPTAERDVFFLARPKTRSWREDIALHYHATVEAMEAAIAARAPLVEKAQKHFLAFLVSLVFLLFSALAAHYFGPNAAWTGVVLAGIAVIAVHRITSPVRRPGPEAAVKDAESRVVAEARTTARRRARPRVQGKPNPALDSADFARDQQAEEEAALAEDTTTANRI